ncbi:hypothetical protein EVAR_91533_1 [Eumeta japonica]|uniref:Uncharacterized protein n=1 Tax=Eumeta variegata TaxID=151549 RepID=A0A4C1VAW3_EUMVA|nr:hypothetical protein EVAR_91533_1 [Eumeta japonica]
MRRAARPSRCSGITPPGYGRSGSAPCAPQSPHRSYCWRFLFRKMRWGMLKSEHLHSTTRRRCLITGRSADHYPRKQIFERRSWKRGAGYPGIDYSELIPLRGGRRRRRPAPAASCIALPGARVTRAPPHRRRYCIMVSMRPFSCRFTLMFYSKLSKLKQSSIRFPSRYSSVLAHDVQEPARPTGVPGKVIYIGSKLNREHVEIRKRAMTADPTRFNARREGNG